MKFAIVAGFAIAFVLGCVPDLDLTASHIFYAGAGHFVGKVPAGFIAREVTRLTPFFLLGGLVLLYLAGGLGWLAARYAPDGRSLAFLALSLALGPGLIVDGVLKDHVHRPRPVKVREFGGTLDFQPYDRIAGPCPRNCSFPSGEAAAGFWLAAPASLAPMPVRPILTGAALLFGAATGLLRMSFGAHFLSDVVGGGVITLLLVAGLRRLLWPAPEPQRASKTDLASPPASKNSIAPIP